MSVYEIAAKAAVTLQKKVKKFTEEEKEWLAGIFRFVVNLEPLCVNVQGFMHVSVLEIGEQLFWTNPLRKK